MSKRLLFLSGEFSATAMMCVRRDVLWTHTTVAREIRDNGNGSVSYGSSSVEYDAVLNYCSLDDDELRQRNESELQRSGVPVWPPLELLHRWGDRRSKLAAALEARLVDDVLFLGHRSSEPFVVERDAVLKVGNLHCGQGKHLVRKGETLPLFDGVATLEPFAVGDSVRVYVVDGKPVACAEYVNEETWIKNDVGCEVIERPLDFYGRGLIDHAVAVHDLHGFDVSASDYVVRADGSFRFLEHNHFPGITITQESEKILTAKLETIMSDLERRVS